MGSLGGAELLMILVLALLLFGPRKLPQIGRSIGRALSEFRSVSNEFRSSLEHEVALEERQPPRTPSNLDLPQATRGSETGSAGMPVSDRAPVAAPADADDPRVD